MWCLSFKEAILVFSIIINFYCRHVVKMHGYLPRRHYGYVFSKLHNIFLLYALHVIDKFNIFIDSCHT